MVRIEIQINDDNQPRSYTTKVVADIVRDRKGIDRIKTIAVLLEIERLLSDQLGLMIDLATENVETAMKI